MRSQFPLFQSHLDLAHGYWGTLVKKGGVVIDATAGNGHDALILAQLALTGEGGRLIVIDFQESAIEKSRKRLEEELSSEQLSRIEYVVGCHSSFPDTVEEGTVQLIVYNLGYLPGGDKSRTTTTSSTLTSVRQALPLLGPHGVISITCYPGHPEGAIEEVALLDFVATLPPTEWSCCHHCWLNRSASPRLLLIQRAKVTPSTA